jgi:hypothetical protein
MTDNLLVGQEDYWEGYRTNFDANKKQADYIELDKLCFEVFGKTEDGKKLLEYFKEFMILPSTPASKIMNYDHCCIYYEGYREAYRQLIQLTKSYVIKKEAESDKALKDAAKGAE